MNIVMELEDRFDLSIPLDRLATVQTVGDLSDLINKLRVKAYGWVCSTSTWAIAPRWMASALRAPIPPTCKFDAVLSPTEGVLDGKQVILLGTNNYLGLTFDPDCIEASAEAVRELGHRHHRLADRQRHLRRPRGAGDGAGQVLRPQARHGLHDRLPGQSGRASPPSSAAATT